MPKRYFRVEWEINDVDEGYFQAENIKDALREAKAQADIGSVEFTATEVTEEEYEANL